MTEYKNYKSRETSEHDEQVALFQWIFMQLNKYPELNNIFAIPNGGHRHKLTAIKLKKEGVRAGVLDIFLAYPKGKYHGLFLEMKVKNNRLQDNQKEWINRLEPAGYKCVVCWSWLDAKQAILEYLEG